MTNHIVGVASLLGVKVGEVFHIENDSSLNGCVFRFSENDLQVSKANGDNDTWRVANDSRLLGLLYGNLSIHKLPWKPKMRENYYTPSLGCKDSLFCGLLLCGSMINLIGSSTNKALFVRQQRKPHSLLIKC